MIGKEANSLATDSSWARAGAAATAECACAGRGGEEQGPGGALAEPAGEQRRVADLGGHLALDVVRVEDGEVGLGGSPVVSGSRSTMPSSECIEATSTRTARAAARRAPAPTGVDLRAERGVHDQPPVAQLVAEPLDQQRAVVGEVAGGLPSARPGRLQVRRAPLVEAGGPGALQAGLRRRGADLAQERAERPAQLQRAARGVAVPERHLARLAGGGGDEHGRG